MNPVEAGKKVSLGRHKANIFSQIPYTNIHHTCIKVYFYFLQTKSLDSWLTDMFLKEFISFFFFVYDTPFFCIGTFSVIFTGFRILKSNPFCSCGTLRLFLNFASRILLSAL